MSDLAGRAPTVSFGPDRRLAVLALVVAAVMGVTALTLDDPPGQLLFGLATLVLVAHAAVNLIYTPRLQADSRGLRIRTPLTRVDLGWDEIEKVDADVRNRLGVRSSTLEVDAGEVLVVFSRWALGVEPDQAAGQIAAMDPRGRRAA